MSALTDCPRQEQRPTPRQRESKEGCEESRKGVEKSGKEAAKRVEIWLQRELNGRRLRKEPKWVDEKHLPNMHPPSRPG